MKVEYKGIEAKFDFLAVGETFVHEDRHYMRTPNYESGDDSYNCVQLSGICGHMGYITCYTLVIRTRMKMVEE